MRHRSPPNLRRLRPDFGTLITIHFQDLEKTVKIKVVVRLHFAFILPLALLSCGLLTSCGSRHTASAKQAKDSPGIERAAIEVAQDRQADDFGRFLAGLPGREGSPYAKYEKDPAWVLHRKAFEADWAKFDEDRVPVLQEFQKKELHGAPNSGGTLFYPFGGPDFVTANLFFPANLNYVFVGLEPAGTVKTAAAFDQKPLASTLPRIRFTLDSLLRRSFFITQQMDAQVRGQITDGLLPLLLVQMVRTGHIIRGHRYVTIDAQGHYADRKIDQAGIRNRGVVIEFQREGSNEVKHLTYFAVNFHNSAFQSNKEFLAFMDQMRPMSTFFKSASYLPHRDGFSLIRETVLAKSNAIAQDDTGIPFKFFDGNKWDVMLYGKYTQPYGSFKFMKQPELRGAFEKGEHVKNLDFYIGYGFGRQASNLLIARRRT